jgi:hypothetical protein
MVKVNGGLLSAGRQRQDHDHRKGAVIVASKPCLLYLRRFRGDGANVASPDGQKL